MTPSEALVAMLLSATSPLPQSEKPGFVHFDWREIVDCANSAEQPPPEHTPEAGQDTDTFIRNYRESQQWGQRAMAVQQCKLALSAWRAGWDAAKSH